MSNNIFTKKVLSRLGFTDTGERYGKDILKFFRHENGEIWLVEDCGGDILRLVLKISLRKTFEEFIQREEKHEERL